MKIRLLSLACVALCAACSAPKMAYKFNYHDYNAGRKAKDVKQEVASNPGPAPVAADELIAMEPVKETPNASIETVETPVIVTPATRTYEDLSKKERRELRREFRKEIKEIVEKKDGVNSVEATQAIDQDLKLAAIFGAVGLVALIIGGQVFWIVGGIALIIGVVFFVKWLIRQ
jgi:hypothetical protein